MQAPAGFPRRALGLMGASAAVLAALALVWALRGVLAPFLVAGAFAFLFAPAVAWCEAKGLARAWAVLLVYACVALAVAALVAFAAPVAEMEARELALRLPGYARLLAASARHLSGHWNALGLPAPIREAFEGGAERLLARWTGAIRGFGEGLGGLFEWLLTLALAPVLAYYILCDWPHIREAALRWLPPDRRQSLLRYFAELDAALSGYVRGQLILALAVAGLATTALFLLGVPYALLLGAFAGAGELVPYLGPVVGAVPAVAVALLRSPELALFTALAFVVIQEVESAVLGPFVLRSTVGLHPLAVIFALLAGAELAGPAGLVLALPATAWAVVTARFLVRELVR
ncbi:MAG: AI-2E family transporter [Clostridia bacterium]|nr:AI-2E family transporter [Clostridia bacterium]